MNFRRLFSCVLGIALLLFFTNTGYATQPESGEEALFVSSTQPDALIVLDLSGSMLWNPGGDDRTYGSSTDCTANTTNCSGTGCSGGYCTSSKTGCSQQCSRLAITKRAVFKILDDNGDSTIDSNDEGSLGVRLGYMRFYNCSSDDTGNDYSSGCNKLMKAIDTKYSVINTTVQAESASGGTPLASALKEAKLYLDAHKNNDSAKNCRQKFVILITDGADTYACSGSGAECDGHRYKNRREFVAKAKALSDGGYKVFVIGFGSAMPPYLRNTLNWAAYYGGTDNPDDNNSGSTTAYNIPLATDCTAASPANTAACCNLNTAGCYPAGISSCKTDSATSTAACYDSSMPYPSTSGNSTANFMANSNDPGYLNLSGYAYLAGSSDQLVAALKASMNIIREATFSFSQASIQSSRTTDENFVYEGSFQPVNDDPFWLGHLRKYPINADGTVASTYIDAGTVLQGTSYSSRNLKTCIGCSASYSTPTSLTDFTTSIDKTYFEVTTDAERDAIVGYIQGNAAYNPENWKLGDVFRSTPITIGSPSGYFRDSRDTSSYSVTCVGGLNCATSTSQTVNAFGYHRCTHCRSSANNKRLIVAGANDGQFHAFRTSDMTEVWSFIPPNFLSKLKNIAHSTHPTALVHQYFVDGPVSGADVWLGSGNGKSKSGSNWKSILNFGLGRGSTERLWSSSASCDSGFSGIYSSTYSNYCGYYTLDLTDSLNPKFMWRLNNMDSFTQAPFLGDSWSKMLMGRILLKSGTTETEKWVGFIGGGYNKNDCSGGGSCDARGKGFFVVDLSNGQILWSFTLGGSSAAGTGSASMKYSLPAPPSIVDMDNDGFIDTAYIGDLGGNMWRMKFCTSAMLKAGSCSTSDWSGGFFFDSSTGSIRPVYTSAAVAKDSLGNIWVCWGTGDKVDPTASNAQEHFYAVKDNLTSVYTVNNIDTISSASQTYDQSKVGYRIQLSGGGQKILAEPTIFGGVVYFTSFVPGSSSDPCQQSGTAYLNGVYLTTANGALTGGVRSMNIGTGIASAPIVSLKPAGGTGSIADLYVTVSGGGLTAASTQKVNFDPPGVSNRTNMLFWKDRRIQ